MKPWVHAQLLLSVSSNAAQWEQDKNNSLRQCGNGSEQSSMSAAQSSYQGTREYGDHFSSTGRPKYIPEKMNK